MEHFDGLNKLIENEIESVVKNGKFRSREEIDSVYKLIDIAKDIACIEQMEDEMYGDSYEDNGYERMNRRRMNPYYGEEMNGHSYERRGRGRNAFRDSMGRYNEGRIYYDGDMTYRGGSYRDGGKEDFADEMRNLMNNTHDEQTRQSIQRMLSQMEQR